MNPAVPPFRGPFTFLCWEAAFAMAYETWIGPIYLSGLAGELGVRVWLVALLTGLPWIGQGGQILGLWIATRVPSPKRYTLIAAGLGRALWLFPLGLALYWELSPEPFPEKRFLVALSILASISSICTSSGTATWYTWMRGIVPYRFRGRFFGTRQRFTMSAVMLANLSASGWLALNGARIQWGYVASGVLAIVAGAISLALLARVRDVPERLRVQSRAVGVKELLEPLRDRRFRAASLFWVAFNGIMQVAGPYFPYFFTRELGFPMTRVALWVLLSNIGSVLSAGLWGRIVDRSLHPLQILWISGLLIVASPLFYMTQSARWVGWIAPPEYFINGIANAGLNIASISLLFQTCPENRATLYFSAHFAMAGLAGGVCTFLGGWIAEALLPWGGFRALWLCGSLLRLLALVVMSRYLGRVLVSSATHQASVMA